MPASAASPLPWASRPRSRRPAPTFSWRESRKDWDRYLEVREIEVVDEFEKRFSELQARGDAAVDELARVVGRAGVTVDPQVVSRLRRRTGFPAVAVYGPDGEAVVWDGIHRGRVPVDVRLGVAGRYAYHELPLFSHLYVTAPVPSIEGTAVVAELMRSELPAGLRAPPVDFESRFARDTGAEIHLSRPQGALGDSWYDLVWGEAILLSMSVATPAESELRSSVGAFLGTGSGRAHRARVAHPGARRFRGTIQRRGLQSLLWAF